MRKLATIGLLLGSLVGFIALSGCSKEVRNEQQLEQQIKELETKVKKQQKAIEQYQANLDQKEAKKAIEVAILEPNTGKVIKRINPMEMDFQKNVETYKKVISDWVKDLARSENGYDKRMFPDKIGADGVIIKGTPRVILSEDELVNRIMDASAKGGQVELPLTVFESGYKLEEVNTLDEVVISSFTTSFDPSVTGRVRNIELSSQAIDNVILGIGDVFSFNTAVGERTEVRGYQKAKEIVNKQMVAGIGGGICQTSSTLYNAVDKLKIKYVEHHNHSLHVGYVPKGRDATVSWGGPDFRFENTVNVPLLLKASVDKEKGKVTIEVRSSKLYASQIGKI
ncbi:VanW family protein [Peribacillus loiseleuriae]|uniref:VanW family protein n=1 Tax=Peribacillus loiseleuriae TaxID=1679170 RepID=UPI0009E29580|nr:VanW family protein [Peribacillus loiseleuriae]